VLTGILLAAGFGWLGICGMLWAAQDGMLFRADPRSLSVAPGGRVRIEELATEDGLALRFLVADPRPGRPVVLMFQGNGGNAADRVALLTPLAARGDGVVIAGYRGYGGNPGAPGEDGLAADARAHLAWVRARFPGAPVVLWGESLGSGVAVRLAAEQGGVAALVLDSPFTSVADRAAELYPWVPVRLLLRHRFPVRKLMPAITVPVLVVHGEEDRIVPPDHGRAVLDAAPQGRGIFLPGVGHPALPDPRAAEAYRAVMALVEAAAVPAVGSVPTRR
jgi:fermentation-respiration switch protein FrsA (DUF1100 family)